MNRRPPRPARQLPWLAALGLLASAGGLPRGQAAEPAATQGSASRPEFWRPSEGSTRATAREDSLPAVEATEEQRAALRELWRRIQTDSRESVARLRQTRQALADAVHGEEPDEARLRELAAEVGRLEGEIACRRARHLAAVRSRLSPSQLEFLRQARGDLTARIQERLTDRVPSRSRPSRRPGAPPASPP
ncbi:MAG: Spy/CpxP family protein refolding chaperone [Verrucomicrobiota bacterium]